jgi:hypothetical protein
LHKDTIEDWMADVLKKIAPVEMAAVCAAFSYRVLHLHKGTMEDLIANVLKKFVPADGTVAVSGGY